MSGSRKSRKGKAPPATPLAKKPKAETPPADDVVLLHSRTSDGAGVNVLRKRGEELSIGVVRPLEDGKPVHGDIVQLESREEHPALFDVKTEVSMAPPASRPGPSRVTSDRYRTGWESLWGRRRRKPN